MTVTQRATNTQITISLPENDFILGESIPLTVTYSNCSGEAVRMRDPARTWTVCFSILMGGKEKQVAHFGRMLQKHMGPDKSVTMPEPAETITVAASGTYSFDYDVFTRWPFLFPPGRHSFQVIDKTTDDQHMESNMLETAVTFSRESVPRLMIMVREESNEPFARRWAARWLQKLKADFDPPITPEGAPDDTRAEGEMRIQQELERFRTWWATSQETDNVRREIQIMNDQYFPAKEPDGSNEQ